MFKISLGFLLGVAISVMHYDYGLTPLDLAKIVIKNGNDIVEEVRENGNSNEKNIANSLLGANGFLSREN